MIDYDRLRYLNNKINTNTATASEKDEYMELLYKNGSITKNQYDKYFSDKNSDVVLKAAITIGGILLLGYLIDKIVKNSS